MLVKTAFLLCCLLLFSGCSVSKPTLAKGEKPSWILHPNESGRIGAVGQCGRHYDGASMQRKVAIARAIDELAMQGEVIVHSEIYVATDVHGAHASHTSKSKTYIAANGVSVKAYIKEIYFDEKKETLYVWLIRSQ